MYPFWWSFVLEYPVRLYDCDDMRHHHYDHRHHQHQNKQTNKQTNKKNPNNLGNTPIMLNLYSPSIASCGDDNDA